MYDFLASFTFSGVVSLVVGLLVPLLAFSLEFGRTRRQWVDSQRISKEVPNYYAKIETLTDSLRSASKDVDKIIEEMAVARLERENALKLLEKQLVDIANREKEIKQRVQTLEQVPLPAVDYFLKMTEQGEKRSAWRDYSLFGLGVIVSTIISIVLKLLGF